MFRAFLKVADRCDACGEELHHHRADDFPAYLVIVIVGHLVVPLILHVEMVYQPAYWIHALLWLPLTLALVAAADPARERRGDRAAMAQRDARLRGQPRSCAIRGLRLTGARHAAALISSRNGCSLPQATSMRSARAPKRWSMRSARSRPSRTGWCGCFSPRAPARRRSRRRWMREAGLEVSEDALGTVRGRLRLAPSGC